MLCRIKLSGCDDVTKFDMELTEEQKSFVDFLAARANAASEYSCQPRMSIEAITPEEENE